MGVLRTFIMFDGKLSTPDTRIVLDVPIPTFILLQRLLSSLPATAPGAERRATCANEIRR